MHTHTHTHARARTQLMFDAAGIQDTKSLFNDDDKQNVPTAVKLLQKVDEVITVYVCACVDVCML